MRQSFEDHQLRICASAQKSPVKNSSIAKQYVARAGHQKTWRHLAQVGKQRREHRIFAISFCGVLIVGRAVGILWMNLSRKSIESKYLTRIARPAEVRQYG